MADEEEELVEEDLDEGELDEDLEGDDLGDDLEEDFEDGADATEAIVDDEEVVETPDEDEEEEPRRPRRRGEDEDEDEDEEADPDDVEADLDEILKDRIAATDDEDEEDEEDDGDAGKGAPSGKIQPRREDEFLCQSCFILKPMGQLAEGETALCVDCV
jgi:hypothetical protein